MKLQQALAQAKRAWLSAEARHEAANWNDAILEAKAKRLKARVDLLSLAIIANQAAVGASMNLFPPKRLVMIQGVDGEPVVEDFFREQAR
jgi:hypothetical protein